MMLHAVPVLRIEACASQIETVGCLLDLLGTGGLAGNGANIFTEKHGVDAQDPVADRVPHALSLNLRVHYLIIIVLGFFGLLEINDRIIEFAVDQ